MSQQVKINQCVHTVYTDYFIAMQNCNKLLVFVKDYKIAYKYNQTNMFLPNNKNRNDNITL